MRNKIIDAAILITISTGFLYFAGYIFELHYLKSLNAPPILFLSETPGMILSGWITLIGRPNWIISILLTFVIIWLLSIKIESLHNFILKLETRPLAVDLIVLFLLAYVIFFNSRELAHQYAKEQLSFAPTKKFEFNSVKEDGFYRLLRYKNGNYLLLSENKKFIIINQNEIKKITFQKF